MTFDEALIKKAKLPLTITYQGSKMKVYIVPLLQSELDNFIEHMNGHRVTNKTAQMFATQGQFTIKGIAFLNNNVSFLTYNELLDELS